MNEAVIEFTSVCKSYPLYHHVTAGIKNFLLNLPLAVSSMRKARFEAICDITFKIRQGETFGIIGRNGAGKSTILGIIAGVLKPSSGTVSVKQRVSPLLELGGGFHPELNGRENILLNGVLLGLSKKQVLQRMSRIVEFSELGPAIEQPIRTYSSGMLARLGFSVIAHLDPEILLIDEILAVGDIGFQHKCLDTLMRFKKNNGTIVIVSHNMNDVKKLCDRVLWIEQKKVKLCGPPDSVTQYYQQTIEATA